MEARKSAAYNAATAEVAAEADDASTTWDDTARAIACAIACGRLVKVHVAGEELHAVSTSVNGLEVCVVIGSSQTQAGASCMCFRYHRAERTAATATGPQKVITGPHLTSCVRRAAR